MILEKNWIEDHRKREELGEVLTIKEVEKLYELPANLVLQDFRRGRISYEHIRQSGKVWLITRAEANRLYSDYHNLRSRKRKKHAS